MIWDIVNPSDACVIEADCIQVAAAACLLLSPHYMLSPASDETEGQMPPFVFGVPEGWVSDTFGDGGVSAIAAYVKDHKAEIAAALRTVCYGTAEEVCKHRSLLATIESEDERKRAHDDYLDRQRTSMNNICASAFIIADNLEKGELAA